MLPRPPAAALAASKQTGPPPYPARPGHHGGRGPQAKVDAQPAVRGYRPLYRPGGGGGGVRREACPGREGRGGDTERPRGAEAGAARGAARTPNVGGAPRGGACVGTDPGTRGVRDAGLFWQVSTAPLNKKLLDRTVIYCSLNANDRDVTSSNGLIGCLVASRELRCLVYFWMGS